MTVKGILFTREKLTEEIKNINERMEAHKKEFPNCTKRDKTLEYDLRHEQYKYSEYVRAYLLGLSTNFDYKASEVEVIAEPVNK